MKKLRFSIKVFSTAVLLISAAVFSMVFVPYLFGLKGYKDKTSSMSPAINAGDIIYVKPADPAALTVGDIITFTPENSDLVVTHRIWRIEKDSGLIYTKGDKNPEPDPEPVPFSSVIGRYVNYKLPLLGFL